MLTCNVGPWAVAAENAKDCDLYLAADSRRPVTLSKLPEPALPFLFGASLPCILASVGITVIAAAVIGHYRGYVVTYAILVAVSAITVGLSIAVA